MDTRILTTEPLKAALESQGLESVEDDAAPLVLQISLPGDAWNDIGAELMRVFEASQAAARAGVAVVYVVDGDDLLGRRGAGNAMAATGVLSAARTLAFEGRKRGVPANVIALEDATAPEVAAQWIVLALGGGVTGEVIRVGGDHIGKALP